MSDPFIAEIKIFAGNFAPAGFAFCNGQLLPISQNSALFSLTGTTYGGDGESTFALPDLRGRVPVHSGNSQGPGLTNRPLGQRSGSESFAHVVPPHTHTFAVPCHTDDGETDEPDGNLPAKAGGGETIYKGGTPNGTMAAGTTGSTGSGGPSQGLMQPYLAVHFIIALIGTYPSEN